MKTFGKADITEHPFDGLFTEGNPKYLVIGSFPTTEKNRTFDFYYPNSRNNFWKIMSEVFPKSQTKLNLRVSTKDSANIKQENTVNRKKFCREHGIAMTDMLASCLRMYDSSNDEKLLVHRYTPVMDILKKHSDIRRIIITAKSSGASAHHHFYQYLVMNDIEFGFETSETIHYGKLKVAGRWVEVFSMYSTSPRSTHKSFEELVALYKQAFGV